LGQVARLIRVYLLCKNPGARLKQRAISDVSRVKTARYLTPDQNHAQFLWMIRHIFWYLEWREVLWSDKVIFLIGERTVKLGLRYEYFEIESSFRTLN
jgi:hypothetical protein